MRRFCLYIVVLVLVSCRDENGLQPDLLPPVMEIPQGFPEMLAPVDNAFTHARWDLGKKLFFDKALSVDNSISCASCHKPELAFSDNIAFSPGVDNRPGTRNAPSLANVGYHPFFTREGGVPTLEMQVLVPIQEHNEFDFNIVLITERLQQDDVYAQMALDAYDREMDPFVITRAIACFERSLISGNSTYDKFIFKGDNIALSASALRGMDLFFTERTNCSSCHNGFNFTNYAFENNGLYNEYADLGRFRLTGNDADMALFKVPGLRNVALTAPYMHDGSMNSLSEVIDHYVMGGKDHRHKSELIHPLNLTDSEKADLLQFLISLTDEQFVSNPTFHE